MAYAELKEKLEKLLTEDLSNRSSLQDVRRNLFLNAEGAKVQQQLIAEKQGEISSLTLLVEKKKSVLQIKDEQIKSIQDKTTELESKISSLETSFGSERSDLLEKIAGLEQQLASAAASESRLAEINQQKTGLEEKINSLETSFHSEKTALLEKIALLEQQLTSATTSESKLTELSLQNEEYAAKIRELIYHIDGQHTEIESLKKQVADKADSEALAVQLEEKTGEIQRLQERSDLLFESEQQLKMLVASQNNEIEAFTKQTNGFKKQIEDIASGWQQQNEQLLIDNANLLAEVCLLKEVSLGFTETSGSISEELASMKAEKEALATVNMNLFTEISQLKETSAANETAAQKLASIQAEIENLLAINASLVTEIAQLKEITANTIVNETVTNELATIKAEKDALVATNTTLLAEISQLKEAGPQGAAISSLSEEQIAEIRSEKEHLAAELELIRHELNVTMQSREEKIIALQSEIGSLQNQIISLSESLNQEAEAKNLVNTQLEQLTSIVAEKEQSLAAISSNKSDEEFVDKLMQQINFLNDQKNNFETLYHDSEAELNLAKANLASFTQLIEGQKDNISDLEETNKHVKLAQTLVLQVKDKTAAKQAINELVREIDKCIALLSE